MCLDRPKKKIFDHIIPPRVLFFNTIKQDRNMVDHEIAKFCNRDKFNGGWRYTVLCDGFVWTDCMNI